MKNFKKFTLGVMGAVLLATGLWACSNDNEAAAVESSKTEFSARSVEKIPSEERNNIYEYFIKYYQITDELQVSLDQEKLNLSPDFNDRLQQVETEHQLRRLLIENKFSDPENYIGQFKRIQDLQINLKEKSPVFSGLPKSVKEGIVLELIEVSFQDYYAPISTARTCAEQYNIDVNRAKRDYGVCGGFALVAAATTGLAGGLPAAAYCMTTYYLDLSDAKSDYNDCIKK